MCSSKWKNKINIKKFKNCNNSDFQYGNGGIEAIRAHTDSTFRDTTFKLDPSTWEAGFAKPYGTSSVDEDLACLSEALFTGGTDFWHAVDRYKVLRNKITIVVNFFNQ